MCVIVRVVDSITPKVLSFEARPDRPNGMRNLTFFRRGNNGQAFVRRIARVIGGIRRGIVLIRGHEPIECGTELAVFRVELIVVEWIVKRSIVMAVMMIDRRRRLRLKMKSRSSERKNGHRYTRPVRVSYLSSSRLVATQLLNRTQSPNAIDRT